MRHQRKGVKTLSSSLRVPASGPRHQPGWLPTGAVSLPGYRAGWARAATHPGQTGACSWGLISPPPRHDHRFKCGQDPSDIFLGSYLYNLCVLSLQSCLTLCSPMACSPPGSSVHRILQGRITGVGCRALPMWSIRGIFPNIQLLVLNFWGHGKTAGTFSIKLRCASALSFR